MIGAKARKTATIAVAIMAAGAMLTGCRAAEYLRLLRPKALKQLNPDMVRLVNELPNVDKQNEKLIGRLFAHGGLGHAKKGEDGVYRAKIHIPSGQFIWQPAIIAMPEGGTLELEFENRDDWSHHAAILPSNGGRVYLELPQYEKGNATINLDTPGLYWFGCPISNHAGRGMLGLVIVGGEVPAEAKLDRPKQPRP
jgi:PQQ system protein